MPDRKRINPVHCLAKEAEYRRRSTDGELTPERRIGFLEMADTWADLAKESDPLENKSAGLTVPPAVLARADEVIGEDWIFIHSIRRVADQQFLLDLEKTCRRMQANRK